MRKIKVLLSIILVSTVLSVQTGCFGSFELTKKVYEFNEGVGDKFVQELVFLVLCAVPVYEIAGAFDLFVLNLIEFWTDANPMAMREGQIEQKLVKHEGKLYQITTTKNQYSINVLVGEGAGNKLDIVYNPETTTWTANNGTKSVELVKFNKRTGIVKFLKGDQEMVFDANQHSLNYMKAALESNVAMK
jgi:hypothetical protein